MTLRLLLIRHAKSSWADRGPRDFDRPLNPRGRRAATLIGQWLQAEDLVPGHALVSPAARTAETWTRIIAETGPVPATFNPALYEPDPDTLLAVLNTAPQAPVIALISHNPAIADFARRLLAEPPSDADFAKYPTAATAVIDFPQPAWSAAAWSTGGLAIFVTPRRLESFPLSASRDGPSDP